LIWHVAKETVGRFDASQYSSARKMPIDIEAAHGKFSWTQDDYGVYNTGVQNSTTGFDSLEIRKISGGEEIQGPYFEKPHCSTPDPPAPFSAWRKKSLWASDWLVPLHRHHEVGSNRSVTPTP